MAEFDCPRARNTAIPMESSDFGREAVAHHTDRTARPPLAARIVLDRLARIRRGHLVVRLPDGSIRTFAGSCGGATAVMELDVHRWRFFSRLLRRADVGAPTSWVCPGFFSPTKPSSRRPVCSV
jgi:hypothetical protein